MDWRECANFANHIYSEQSAHGKGTSMNAEQISFADMENAYRIATQMERAGLSHSFIEHVVELAKKEFGTLQLIMLWSEAPTEEDRCDVVADLQKRLDEVKDHQEIGATRDGSKPQKRQTSKS